MRASDSGYDPRQGHANSVERPRRQYTRWVLLAGLMFVLTVPVMAMLRPGSLDRLLANVAPLSLLLIIGSTMSPFSQKPFMTERGLAKYAEAERSMLLMAGGSAYLADIILVVATFIWLAIAQTEGLPFPHRPSQWTTVGFALVATMAMLPVLIAGFIVPMPDAANQTI